jgi:adenylate kinase
MLNIVLFGPPGSGKGTQSENLIKKYGLIHLSTGDILRDAIANKTPLGLKAKEYMEKGELVPDEDVVNMVVKRLDTEKNPNGFIFDGFPRTCGQAQILRDLLTERDTRINVMITLEVNHDELIKRLVKRGRNSGRTDDTLEVIKNRIEVYERDTAPVIDFYKTMHKYRSVDGIGSIEEIFDRIVQVVEEMK